MRFRYSSAEIAMFIETIVQTFYLVMKKATYSEYFFGFKRSKLVSGRVAPLTPMDIGMTLLFETFLPYANQKLRSVSPHK